MQYFKLLLIGCFKTCTCDCLLVFKSTSYFGLYLVRVLVIAFYIISFKFTFSVHDLPFSSMCVFLNVFYTIYLYYFTRCRCRAFHQHFDLLYALFCTRIYNWREFSKSCQSDSLFVCRTGGFHWRFYCRRGRKERISCTKWNTQPFLLLSNHTCQYEEGGRVEGVFVKKKKRQAGFVFGSVLVYKVFAQL